jgi:hypothetical protein
VKKRRGKASGETSLADWLRDTQSSWAVLAQGAVWLLGLLGGFLLSPPVGVSTAEDRTWLRFGQFIVAVLLGLVLFAALKWKRRKHGARWWGAACVSLLLAVVAFFVYQRLLYGWTAEYDGRPIVIGSEYTPHARAYVEKNPNLPLKTLLEDFLGRAEDIWTRNSINQHRLVLAGVYVSCLPLFTLAVIAIVQALRCLGAVGGTTKSDPAG